MGYGTRWEVAPEGSLPGLRPTIPDRAASVLISLDHRHECVGTSCDRTVKSESLRWFGGHD
jgi:hypothetical protein